MEKYLLRSYRPEDCLSVTELFYGSVHCLGSRDYAPEQLDAWAPHDTNSSEWNAALLLNHSIVAESNGMIVGFGDMSEAGYLDRLYVGAGFDRKGVGSKIAEELENYARQNGIRSIAVDASITAKPFFQQRDYRVLQRQTVWRKGVAIENVHMEKRL